MATNQVFEALFNRFGTNPFKIDEMSPSMVEELAELAGRLSLNSHGTKSQFGKWLSSIARGKTECVLGKGQRVRLVLKREGTGHPAARYQFQLWASR